MALNTRALVLAGALAGTTLFAAPAAAASFPATGLGAPSAAFDASRYDPAATIADWRCRGYRCGYGRRGFRRGFGGGFGGGYRRGVGAGDVLIGAAIIGGIAAIVNSNNRRQRDRDVVVVERDVRVRDDDRRFDDRRLDDRQGDVRRSGSGASGLDSAVDQCLTRIERDVRVDTVDNVERTGAGWVVSGALFNGTPFQCRIGNTGQIDGIDYSGGLSRAPTGNDVGLAGAQWSDERYADARRAAGGSAPAQVATIASSDRLPAYPGGPIPGEVIPETIDGDL